MRRFFLLPPSRAGGHNRSTLPIAAAVLRRGLYLRERDPSGNWTMAGSPPERNVIRTVAAVSEPNKAASAAQEPEFDERRANTRFALSAQAEVVELRSQARITSRSSDLGLGGCYVDTLTPFPVGSPVKVRLAQASRTFEAQATVIYAHVGMGMGLAFSEVQPDQLATLQDWVRELSGELPSALDSAETPAPEQPFLQSERLVLNQLITLLIRKRFLTETEGATLLRQLFH